MTPSLPVPQSHRPLIGVPTQTLQAIDGIPKALPHSWVMNFRYFTALASAGAAPVMIPLLAGNESALRVIYERLDGLFLAGGVDVDPASYREDKLDVCGTTDPDRDAVELLLTKWAMEDGKPVLGVCRGLQLINVACGGTLLQHLDSENSSYIKHDYFPNQEYPRDYMAHAATVQPGSRMAEIYGAGEIRVNSMHHQGIRSLGEGLTASIHASDGLVEGIEGAGEQYLMAVQWHPEVIIDADPATLRLFESFVHACEVAV
jgi:putative glutamine amidotransferase